MPRGEISTTRSWSSCMVVTVPGVRRRQRLSSSEAAASRAGGERERGAENDVGAEVGGAADDDVGLWARGGWEAGRDADGVVSSTSEEKENESCEEVLGGDAIVFAGREGGSNAGGSSSKNSSRLWSSVTRSCFRYCKWSRLVNR
jgi:hypothetical protein